VVGLDDRGVDGAAVPGLEAERPQLVVVVERVGGEHPRAAPRQLVAEPRDEYEDEDGAWAGEDDESWEGPDDADDYEPVAAPPRNPRDQLRPDPRPMVAEARRHAEAEARQREEDAYLAELRKAMVDEQPLGPRDDPDDYEPPAAPARSRFGRRR